MSTAYGPLVSLWDVRAAAIGHLKLWLPSYLAEVSRQNDLSETLVAFRGYTLAAMGDAFPVCVVECANTEGQPYRHSTGMTGSQCSVVASAVVSAATREDATQRANLYATAIRAVLLQHPSVGSIARGTTWDGESTEEIAYDDTRVIVAGTSVFTVDVPAMVNGHLGLSSPPADPSTAVVIDTPDTITSTFGRLE